MEYEIKSLDGEGLGGYIINNIDNLNFNKLYVYVDLISAKELEKTLRHIIGIANFWEDFHKYDIYAMRETVKIIRKEIENKKGKSLVK